MLQHVSNGHPDDIPGRVSSVGKDLLVTGDNVEKLLTEGKKKTVGEDSVAVDLLKDKKMQAMLFSRSLQCYSECLVPLD